MAKRVSVCEGETGGRGLFRAASSPKCLSGSCDTALLGAGCRDTAATRHTPYPPNTLSPLPSDPPQSCWKVTLKAFSPKSSNEVAFLLSKKKKNHDEK